MCLLLCVLFYISENARNVVFCHFYYYGFLGGGSQ